MGGMVISYSSRSALCIPGDDKTILLSERVGSCQEKSIFPLAGCVVSSLHSAACVHCLPAWAGERTSLFGSKSIVVSYVGNLDSFLWSGVQISFRSWTGFQIQFCDLTSTA